MKLLATKLLLRLLQILIGIALLLFLVGLKLLNVKSLGEQILKEDALREANGLKRLLRAPQLAVAKDRIPFDLHFAHLDLGAFLDLVNAMACIGTAVALFSVVKRQHEGFALGFVTTRIFEAAVITVGVLSLIAVVTLRQAGAAGAEATTLVIVGQALVAVRDAAHLLGPGVVPGLNAVLLGYLMYRSRLVPRAIPAMALIGAPLFLVAMILVGFQLAGRNATDELLATWLDEQNNGNFDMLMMGWLGSHELAAGALASHTFYAFFLLAVLLSALARRLLWAIALGAAVAYRYL